MRLLPNISYGTERYPEKIARRLRVLNVTAWCSAVVASGFAVSQVFDRALHTLAFVSGLMAFIFASLPSLHRFGSLAAPLTFAITSYAAFL